MDIQFRHLSLRLVQDFHKKSELSNILNELNSLDFKAQIIDEKHIFDFIETLSKLQVENDLNVYAKLLSLIDQMISHQRVLLPTPISNKIIKWILNSIHDRKLEECFFVCEALRAMTTILKFSENDDDCSMFVSEILSTCDDYIQIVNQSSEPGSHQKFIDADITPQELQKSSLSCFEAILRQLSSSQQKNVDDDKISGMGEVIVNSLCSTEKQFNFEIETLPIVVLKVSCLKSIVHLSQKFTLKFIGELIGICKSFSLILSCDETVKRPVKLYPSQHSIVDTNDRSNNDNQRQRGKKNFNKKLTNSRNNNESANPFAQYKTSDSEFSDADSMMPNSNRYKLTKLRFNSLSLLLSICWHVDNRTIIGYWQSLMSPDEQSCSVISSSFSKDPSPKCRILSLQILICLIKKCRNFLMQADNKDKAPMTFTPFSISLGNTICSLYDHLTQSLSKEGNLTVLAQLLKCISTFVTATPFSRLSQGIVTKFMVQVKRLVQHKDPTIQVASLIVAKNLISIKNITPEIFEIVQIPKNSKIEFDWKKFNGILKSDVEAEMEGDVEFEEEEDNEDSKVIETKSDYKMSWLLCIVFEYLGVFNSPPSTSGSVKIECLQILSQTSVHTTLLRSCMNETSKALVNSLSSGADEKLYACKSIESIGQSINVYFTEDDSNLECLDTALTFWTTMIPNIIENLQHSQQSPNLRSTLADSLSNIGIHVFEKLGRQQFLIISVLTGCSYDDSSLVSSSAVRALAVYALFPSLRGDMCFIENTIELILRIAKDTNVAARSKATWSMGNIVDALLLSNGSLKQDILLKIIQENLRAIGDNDRVRINASRIIGNIFTLLNEEQMKNREILECFQTSISSLSTLLLDCNNDKLKWNICYAFTNIMKNSTFFESTLIDKKWKEQVFPAMFQTITNSSNFKVRINACIAFKNLDRSQLGNYFIDAWNCLLLALEKSTELTDYNEYKHRDELQDKICLSICHMIEISSFEDISPMKSQLVPIFDITKQNWNRVYNRWSPEDQGIVLAAVSHYDKMTIDHPSEEKSIKFLINCFKPIEYSNN